jgi:dihydrofolate synthase/folylpolyglutamate synthase
VTSVEYEDVLDYIYNLERMGIKLGLKNVRHLLKKMGNPEESYKIIHIAGTNGKGSTAAMVQSILQEAGFKVGMFTSPHLLKYEERFNVNGDLISPAEVIKIFNGMKPILDSMKAGEGDVNHPTFFEMTTAIALQFFADREVDFAVLEVGLGGRLDATNAPLSKAVCAITTISRDHTQYLGDDLGTIAFEKAGIVTKDTPLVLGVDRELAEDPFWTICQIALTRGSDILSVGPYPEDDIQFQIVSSDTSGVTANYAFGDDVLESMHIPLMGDYQAVNAGVALGIVQCLVEDGHTPEEALSPNTAAAGLSKTKWRGRAELVRYRDRDWFLDTAHNPEALEKVTQILQQNFADSEKVLLFGVMDDKDYQGSLAELLPMFKKVVLTKPSNPRTENPEKIKNFILENKLKGEGDVFVVEDCGEAAEKALELAAEKGLIVNTGSFFCVSEVISYLEG